MTHPEPAPEPAPEPGFSGVAAAGIALLFLLLRIVLLVVRAPFFDEQYTLWMARQPLGSIVPHLLHDSGPPLYYLLARIPSVDALRWMSLAFAAIAFVLVARRSLIAAALLAVYPPAVLYATEARAYALCGLLIAIGVVYLERGGHASPLIAPARPAHSTFAFVLAAYTHYYGVLFFPLLFFRAQGAGRRAQLFAFGSACLLFAPGFFLALQQPSAATAWNVQPQYWVLAASVVPFVLLSRTWRFAPAVLIPLALVIAFALAGRNIYFPMRFESVLAVPLVLWAAASLERWRPAVRYALIAVLMIAGGAITVRGIAAEMQRPTDSRVRAAMFAARFGPSASVVAADYCYLIAAAELGPRVRAFPPAQGEHPGWYAPPSMEAALAAARSLPVNGFVFIGDAGTPELAALRQVRRVQLRFRDGLAVVLWVEPRDLTATVH